MILSQSPCDPRAPAACLCRASNPCHGMTGQLATSSPTHTHTHTPPPMTLASSFLMSAPSGSRRGVAANLQATFGDWRSIHTHKFSSPFVSVEHSVCLVPCGILCRDAISFPHSHKALQLLQEHSMPLSPLTALHTTHTNTHTHTHTSTALLDFTNPPASFHLTHLGKSIAYACRQVFSPMSLHPRCPHATHVLSVPVHFSLSNCPPQSSISTSPLAACWQQH